jgi:glycosyltransferase involved in cell wall biosynthesis
MPNHQKRVAWLVYQELMRIDPRRNFDCVVGTIWDLDLAGVIASRRWPVVMYLVTSYALMLDSKPEWKGSHHFFEAHVKKMMDAELWAMNRVNLVLSSTQQILKDIELSYSGGVAPQKIACVPFGIPQIKAIKRVKTLSHEITLLFVGRFEYRKGIDLLFQILPTLMNEYEHLQVILVGQIVIGKNDQDGEWHQFQARYQGESWWHRITCLGEVDDEGLIAAYAQADIFIAPSRYESFGLIYLEAMRQALPCIGFNVGGIPEVVIDGETGFLVELENIESLERGVRVLIEDPKLRENFGIAGLKRFEKIFTLEMFANNFLAEINEVK